MILYTSSFTGCGTPKSLFRLLMIVDLNIGDYKLQRPVIQATKTIKHNPHRDRFAFHSSIFPNWPVFFFHSAEEPLPVNTCRFAMRSACLSALVSWKLVSIDWPGRLFIWSLDAPSLFWQESCTSPNPISVFQVFVFKNESSQYRRHTTKWWIALTPHVWWLASRSTKTLSCSQQTCSG